ncbi:something about silencing protein 10 [Platysternon megacephalum]|uniref:Something about silencing protein 10 n=1 Tax=Platysternon megacephalum TaxID=55544 RepID=A0A4D9E780_9SAUR|nr:something about silencing protein 10 [Platysternon megacephalum]
MGSTDTAVICCVGTSAATGYVGDTPGRKNYLGTLKGVELMLQTRRNLKQILAIFPGVNIVWSDMLQCRVWWGAMNPPWWTKPGSM